MIDDAAAAEGAEGMGGQAPLTLPLTPSHVAAPSAAKTLVLGLGNPILRDDGVGWRVVQEVERLVSRDEVECDCVALGGLALMERLTGYARAILVDAIQTPGGTVGQVWQLGPDDLPTRHANGAHDASLRAALALGRHLGVALPTDILIIGVEAKDVLDFGEALSPAVELAVPLAVQTVLKALG